MRTLALVFGTVSLLIIGFILTKNQRTILPLKCTSYTRYDLGEHDDQLLLELDQDLHLESLKYGYFLLNGKAITEGKVTTLNRTVHLGLGERIDNNTYRYHIQSITASTTDNTPDTSFNQLMAEFNIDPANLQLSMVKIDSNAYLVGGPVSYLFTCILY
ncbi:Uncharacterised protein [Serratia grimesii]|jgi:hypothetical protein|uniref:FidL-like protein n=1 Tax=Serratia grimesii TaxID=82995 RepID=UPI001F4C1BAA|nr:FidL-like protein [Serratia grimesii]CAI2793924.1 Uncharacterised protein [Serratia grimesii]